MSKIDDQGLDCMIYKNDDLSLKLIIGLTSFIFNRIKQVKLGISLIERIINYLWPEVLPIRS